MNDFGVKAGTKDSELSDEQLQRLWHQYCRNRSPAAVALIGKSKGEQDRRGRELLTELRRRGFAP